MAYIKDFVSVVIPTYNRENTLRKSIKSVTKQTYDQIEILVVDDGSTDNTHELVQQMTSEDQRIRYLKNTGAKGVSDARNTGIRAAKGEFIAFNDSDDYFHKDKISKQIEKFGDADFCFGRFEKIIDHKEYVIPSDEYDDTELNGDIYELLLHDNLIGCPTLMVRHALLDKTGGFDTSFPALEDYDMALRLAKNGKAAFVGDVILDSDFTEESISASNGNFVAASIMILQKYLPDIIKAGELEYKVNGILTNAEYWGVKEKTALVISHILSQYEESLKSCVSAS